MNVRWITTTLGVILTVALWPAMPLSAQDAGGPAPPPIKGPASKTAEPKPQDSLKEPKAQPPEPKTSDAKTQEPKGQDAGPPKPKDQDPKPQEPGGKLGRSLILTVKLTLMTDPRLFPYEIEVDLSGQEAVLSGAVASEEDKQAATEIAQRVDGIKSVVNKLKVVKELPQALSRKRDEAITQYVKERFKKSTTLEAAGFDVKTEDGVVSLSGRTRFQVIILEAVEAARQTPGVKAVRTDGVRLEAAD
ncbi:MAG: BON domain-containing protein [Nitrospirota bacterium]|nr:BON domain-containing protein [Nitrospirota bacterium]